MNRSYTSIFCISFVYALVSSCASDDPSVDCNSSGLTVAIVGSMDDQCGQSRGEVEVTASGSGNPTISIDAPNVPFAPLPNGGGGTFTDLPSGFYTIILQNADGCFVSDTVTINNVLSTIAFEVDSVSAGCGLSNGSISANLTNGVEPVQYSLDGGAFQSEATFEGLASGSYTILVRDLDGCESSKTVDVINGTSYSSDIQPIITASCAIPNCHDGGTVGLPNWSVLANVQDNLTRIKERTGSGEMPPPGQPDLTQEQIDAIACWVDDGGLDN